MPKQEGFAVHALKGHGEVIRWRCCHTWEYNGRRDLPAGATNKTQHRELAEGSDLSFCSNLIVGQAVSLH